MLGEEIAYESGDKLNLNCSSAKSFPASHLQFYINDDPVSLINWQILCYEYNENWWASSYKTSSPTHSSLNFFSIFLSIFFLLKKITFGDLNVDLFNELTYLFLLLLFFNFLYNNLSTLLLFFYQYNKYISFVSSSDNDKILIS